MKKVTNNSDCKPMVECEVSNPYGEMSVLAKSQCYHVSVHLIIHSLSDERKKKQ